MSKAINAFFTSCSPAKRRSCCEKYMKKMNCPAIGNVKKDNSEQFDETRELSKQTINEFAARSKWTSLLRKSLLCLEHLMHSLYFAEISKMAHAIQCIDRESAHGHRAIVSSLYSRLLMDIKLNKKLPLDRFIIGGYDLKFSEDRRTVVLSLQEFSIKSTMKCPQYIDVFRIYMVIAQLSDWVWDEKEGYRAVVKDLNLLTKCSVSDWMNLRRGPVDIQLEASFDEPALSQPGTTVIVAIGIELTSGSFINTDSKFYGQGTMGIVDCFVK